MATSVRDPSPEGLSTATSSSVWKAISTPATLAVVTAARNPPPGATRRSLPHAFGSTGVSVGAAPDETLTRET